jgi:surfactin synthase thioesterase subunit
MKIKALLLGLLIAGATALTYTAITENAEQAIDRTKIRVPEHG